MAFRYSGPWTGSTFVVALALASGSCLRPISPPPQAPAKPRAASPVHSGWAEKTLKTLTLEEKVAQLGSRWAGNDMHADASPSDAAPSDAAEHATGTGGQEQVPLAPLPASVEELDDEATFNVAPMQDVFTASGTVPLEEASAHGLGQLTRVYGSRPVTVADGAAEVVRQQHTVLANDRLGIPALVHEECLTGFTAYGATVYPAAIAWGATFDPSLIEEMASAIGADMKSVGTHQGRKGAPR